MRIGRKGAQEREGKNALLGCLLFPRGCANRKTSSPLAMILEGGRKREEKKCSAHVRKKVTA